MPVKPIPLTEDQLKRLLKDLEATGVARNKVDVLTTVFQNHEDYYGTPGTVARASFLKKWYQLRRNSLASYCKWAQIEHSCCCSAGHS